MKKLTEASKHIILSILAAAFVLVMIMAVSQLANASGGGDGDKVNNPWQNVSDTACVMWSPEGLTAEVCVDDPDGQAGQDYLCTLPATCPDGLVIEDD